MITISPKYLFLAVWIVPLLGAKIFTSDILLKISVETSALIGFHIFLVFLCSSLFSILIKEKIQFDESCFFNTVKITVFQKRADQIFKTWLFLYLVNIIASGGVPLAWLVTNNGKSYGDFGVPSLNGFCNMLRACCISAYYLLNLSDKCFQNRRRNWYKIGIFIISAFGLELSRGSGIVMLLHPVGIHFLFKRFSIYDIIKGVLVFIGCLFAFGYFQILRYRDGDEIFNAYLKNSNFSEVEGVSEYFVPSIVYICIPIVNTELNIQLAPYFKFEPFYSLTSILPTFVRQLFVRNNDYGELINDGNNASSYYIPFIRDFGAIGCGIVVSALLVLSFYIHARARSGSAYYILIWPPIFMSLMLSFFSLFFLSLIVLSYPLAVLWLIRGAVKQKNSKHETQNV
jgi:hypothetical protein